MKKQKRKTITVYQKNIPPIYLEDEDSRNMTEYSEALSSFMTLTNISILETSTASLITRPSEICAIEVHEETIHDAEDQPVKVEENKEAMDIITDVD
jgi:hypothetical protein